MRFDGDDIGGSRLMLMLINNGARSEMKCRRKTNKIEWKYIDRWLAGWKKEKQLFRIFVVFLQRFQSTTYYATTTPRFLSRSFGFFYSLLMLWMLNGVLDTRLDIPSIQIIVSLFVFFEYFVFSKVTESFPVIKVRTFLRQSNRLEKSREKSDKFPSSSAWSLQQQQERFPPKI